MARILIIDDEKMVRQTLRESLEGDGHAIGEAADGEEGLQIFLEKEPDLVITDILMPNKDGIETIQALCRLHPGLPIIAISGGGKLTDTTWLLPAKVFGATSVLEKPFSLKALREAVNAALTDCRPACAG